MQRYFFDCQDGDHLIRDEEGSLLKDEAKACSETIILLAELVREELLAREKRRFTVISRDENGQFTYQDRVAKKELPDAEQRRFTVVSRDESGQPIYQASLEFHGGWKPQCPTA